jgi:hypothetical protein
MQVFDRRVLTGCCFPKQPFKNVEEFFPEEDGLPKQVKTCRALRIRDEAGIERQRSVDLKFRDMISAMNLSKFQRRIAIQFLVERHSTEEIASRVKGCDPLKRVEKTLAIVFEMMQTQLN